MLLHRRNFSRCSYPSQGIEDLANIKECNRECINYQDFKRHETLKIPRIIKIKIINFLTWNLSNQSAEVYSERSQASKMERFAKISILNVWQGSEYGSDLCQLFLIVIKKGYTKCFTKGWTFLDRSFQYQYQGRAIINRSLLFYLSNLQNFKPEFL